MFGDSTIRQLYSVLARRILGRDIFKNARTQLVEADEKHEPENNTHLYFKFHNVPILHGLWHNISEHKYIASEIDAIGNTENAIVLVSVWAHLQPLSDWFYGQRIRSIANAAEKLLQRNPKSFVAFKGANTLYIKKVETYSHNNGFYVRQHEEVLRSILSEYPNFGFMDAWDMSKAQMHPDDTHPRGPHTDNVLMQVLTMTCLK